MKKEKSCGAIIIKDKKVLMVKSKKGDYGFPKGHIEKNETEIETAIRETKEETNVDIIIENQKQYKISYISKKGTIKDAIYFIAKSKEPINLIPEEKEIAKVFWKDLDQVRELLPHENIKKLWDKVLLEI